MFESIIFTFVLLNISKAQTCPPTVETYCLEGRDGFNSVINGEYIYEGCYNNMPYFRNQNRNTETFYAFFYDSDTILIGPDYTTLNANALCEQSSMENCNQNWIIWDGDAWPTDADSSIYFGSDCNYAHNTASLCTELTDVSIFVAFDTNDLSGIYQVQGCYDSQPHFTKETPNGNDVFIYYNYDALTYYISDTFGDTSDPKATCDLSIYNSISNCLFVEFSTDHSITLSFDINENTFDMLYIGFPLSAIFFIAVIAVIIKSKKEHSEQNDNSESKKCTFKFVAKCMFVFLIKPLLEIYDYYTDFNLARIWMNYHGLGTRCPINYDKYAYTLLICASFGFMIGVVGHIYSVFHSYCVNKRLSYQSLTDLKQTNVNYCVLTKMFVEDIVAIVICIIVAQSEIGVTDTEWWFAYYSSCVGFMLSAILLIRKVLPILIHTKKGVFVIGLLVSAPFGLPLYPSGKGESSFDLRLGFALNDNECQIFENGDGRYLTFDVDDHDLYTVHCGAVFDSSGSSGFEYDYGYYSGLYCTLYEPNSDDSILCKFWMFEQQCWTGNCSPYDSNMTACFGYIGFE